MPVIPRAVCAGAAAFPLHTYPRAAHGRMYVELVKPTRISARRPRLRPFAPPPASAPARPPPPRQARPLSRDRAARPASRWPAARPLGPICMHRHGSLNRAHTPHRASHARSKTPWRDTTRRCCCCAPFPPAAAAANRQLGHFGASAPNGHSGSAAPTNSCPEASDLSNTAGRRT